MKKLLGASLSVALVYGFVAAAQAELLKNLKTDGEVEVHAVVSNNLTDLNSAVKDKDGRAHTRVILNASFDLNEDASGVVTIGKTGAGRTYGTAAQSATAVEGEVLFDQAYMNLKHVLGFDHKLGRQFYGMPGDLVAYYGPSRGPTVRTLPITAIDAWTGWYDWGEGGHMHGHVILGKTSDSAAPGETDVDLRGVGVNCTQYENLTPQLRIYDKFTHTAGSKGHLYTIAPKVTGKAMDGNLGYSAELALNTGNNPGAACTGDCKASGTALLANANYSMPFMGKLKLMGEFGLGSGDDKTTDSKATASALPSSDYRPGDVFGGNITIADLNPTIAGVQAPGAGLGAGGAGLTTFNVGFWHDTEKWPKLGWGVHFYDFSATKKNASPTGKKHLGSEVDLRGKWTHSDKLALSAGYGFLTPDISGADPVTQYYVNFHVMF